MFTCIKFFFYVLHRIVIKNLKFNYIHFFYRKVKAKQFQLMLKTMFEVQRYIVEIRSRHSWEKNCPFCRYCKRSNVKVLYICDGFWLLAHLTRDLYQTVLTS